MTLDNLIGKLLERINPDSSAIQRLLEAAQRNIKDAELAGLSNENRFDAAYKAIMQLSNAALQAAGFRTLTSKPGHHQTMLQSLIKTVGIDTNRLIVLDALRKQRNVADYSGDLVEDAVVAECIKQAKELLVLTESWLKLSEYKLQFCVSDCGLKRWIRAWYHDTLIRLLCYSIDLNFSPKPIKTKNLLYRHFKITRHLQGYHH